MLDYLLILLLTCRQDHISVMRKSSKWNYKRKPILFAFNLSDLSIQTIKKGLLDYANCCISLHIINIYVWMYMLPYTF